MEKKKYYAITTSMLFEKTVLVPVNSVKDIDEAMELVDTGVEVASISLMQEDAEFDTRVAAYADRDGTYELTEDEASLYDIYEGDYDELEGNYEN